MEATARRLIEADIEKLALKSYERHTLHKRDDAGGRWILCRHYEDGSIDGCYFTEVISLAGGALYVGGDIGPVVFAHYSPSKPAEAEGHRGKVRWMGRRDQCCSYVHEKSRIGLGDNGKLTTSWDSDLAAVQIEEELNENPDIDEEEAEELQKLIEMCRSGSSAEEIWFTAYSDGTQDFLYSHLGEHVSSRVVYAWAALRKLDELLEE